MAPLSESVGVKAEHTRLRKAVPEAIFSRQKLRIFWREICGPRDSKVWHMAGPDGATRGVL